MCLLLLSTVASFAAELHVGTGQTYDTITLALQAAGSGDTILVHPGTYSDVIDLRGTTIYLKSTDGLAVTNIVTPSPIYLDGGSVEGFTMSPAPSTGVVVEGAGTVRHVVIDGPASYGIEVKTAGGALVEEVAVLNSGYQGIKVGGTAGSTIRRSVVLRSGHIAFAIESTSVSTVQNNIAIGSTYGYRNQSASHTYTNNMAISTVTAGLTTTYDATFTNGVLTGGDDSIWCYQGTSSPTLPNGIVSPAATRDCPSTILDDTMDVDPGFVAYSEAATTLYDLDLRPASGSPMIDAGSGSDPGGGTADLGAFGGSGGDWSDDDADGVPVLFDCDDDGVDDDCDGVVDGGTIDPDDTGGTGTTDDTGTVVVVPEDLDGDTWFNDVDCDEHNVASHPSATEIMDGADNDCDGAIDEGTAASDDDGDGYSEFAGDCDDTNPERFPGARDDRIDGIDNDCDGKDDNAVGNDDDADGVLDSEGDCDDNDPFVNPTAPDTADGMDNDCDGSTDEDTLQADVDGDGVTPQQGDCNDANADIHAGATDVPDDFIDQDCTGSDNYDVDRDGDPAPASGGTDCDDLLSTVAGTLAERCADGVDNNCDAAIDEGCESYVEPGISQITGCGECGGMRPAEAAVLLLGGLGLARRRRVDAAAEKRSERSRP